MTYHVSIMATRDDNGYCCTFATLDEARRFYRWALDQGVYHAELWAC